MVPFYYAGTRPGSIFPHGAEMQSSTLEKCPTILPSDLEQLEIHVQSRVAGRVRAFRLVVCDEGLILQGHASTYYAKQLAQQAVMAGTTLPIVANEIEVS